MESKVRPRPLKKWFTTKCCALPALPRNPVLLSPADRASCISIGLGLRCEGGLQFRLYSGARLVGQHRKYFETDWPHKFGATYEGYYLCCKRFELRSSPNDLCVEL